MDYHTFKDIDGKEYKVKYKFMTIRQTFEFDTKVKEISEQGLNALEQAEMLFNLLIDEILDSVGNTVSVLDISDQLFLEIQTKRTECLGKASLVITTSE